MAREGAEVEHSEDHWEIHCPRCGDEAPRNRDSRLCESCVKNIQTKKILDGVRCERCNGHGYIYDTWCDIQRATNGRDTICPNCGGSGTVTWEPDEEDVHPDLRMQAHIEGAL